MKSHRLLDGRLVDLVDCDDRQKAFLRDLQKMVRQGVSYFEVYRAAVGPGSPALQGRSRIDRRIVESPLYLVARDIATRAGISQGLVLAPAHEDERAAAPPEASMISVAQSADVVGITRAAIYKAIEKGTLEAIRIGNVTVVSRASAESYRDRREPLDKAQPRPRVRGRLRRAAKRPHADSAAARPAV
jgi:predicted DNA-binding transcriptional regulator AlpA